MTAIVVFVAAVMFLTFGIIKIIGAVDNFKRRRLDAAVDCEFSVLENTEPPPSNFMFRDDHDVL